MPNINLIYYLLAGGIFGALALKTGIPAAPLAGSLIGASILSISGKIDIAEWPTGTRTILEIGIGTVIGTSLTCLLYTSPSPRDLYRSRMPSSA